MTRAQPVSLWEVTAQEADILSGFDGAKDVDVAIIGGGFTGLSTALHCAERGLHAHVLEAEQIGHGGSGRNVGLVNAASWLPPRKLRERLGDDYGHRFIERFGKAPALVFDLIERHQIRCEVTRTGTIHAAHAPSGLADLKARHAEWRRLGEPVDLLSRAQIKELIGSNIYHGGLLDHRAGTINPMGYCRGLARAAIAAGAEISCGVRALRLKSEAGRWTVATDRGEIRARQVVLGTNAYTDGLWPGLRDIFTIIHYFQFATEPLGPEAAHILPGRQGLWDTGPIMFDYRRDGFDRLLIGSMGRIIGAKTRGLSHRWAQKQIQRVFPDLGAVKFEQAWHGKIAMTPDHLPRIHKLADGVWTAIGYNGRGITTGTVFGAAIAELLTGMDPANLPLPVTPVRAASQARLTSLVYDVAFTANQTWRAL